MADALAVARNADGSLASATKKKLLKILGKIHHGYTSHQRALVMKWISVKKPVTIVAGSNLYNALTAIQAVVPFY